MKVIKVTGQRVALSSAKKKIDLCLTDASLNYHDIEAKLLESQEGEVKQLSFRIGDRAGAKVRISLEGKFFIDNSDRKKPFLRKEVEQGLRVILQNLTLSLNPEAYYGQRLYTVLDMNLPKLIVPGDDKSVALSRAAGRSYGSMELVFNPARAADLEAYQKGGRVNYEIHTTRHDGKSTIVRSGSLSFSEIKTKMENRAREGEAFDIGAPMSAFGLSSIRLTYRLTAPGGTIEDGKKDFLQLRLVEEPYQKIDMKAVNQQHPRESLDMKFALDGKDIFKYLNVDYPAYPVFQDGVEKFSFNSLQRLDLPRTTKKTEDCLLLDMSAFEETDYFDRKSFLRVKGVGYFDGELPSGVVNVTYEMFDKNNKPLSSEKHEGHCRFREAGEDDKGSHFLHLAAKGKVFYFELDIKDSREHFSSGTLAYYRIDLSTVSPVALRREALVTDVAYYYNRSMSFEVIAREQDFPFEDFELTSPGPKGTLKELADLKAFLEGHVLAYTSIPFSFERMAQDVVIEGDLSESLKKYASIHGYSRGGRKVFSTSWLDKSTVLDAAGWWRGVDVLVLSIWVSKQDIASASLPYSRQVQDSKLGNQYVPYSLSIKGQFNPYIYIPCLAGNHDYELDPLFANTLYLMQGRSRVQGRGSLNTLYLMWDTHTTFDFAAEEDFERGIAPTRFKLIGVDIQSITLDVPEPEHELWGSLVLEWAVSIDPAKELKNTRDPALLAFVGESQKSLKAGSLTLVNFLKEPISGLIEFEIAGRVYTLEMHPGDKRVHWRRHVDLNREKLGEKTVASSVGGQIRYVQRNTLLGKADTPIHPSDDGQDILVARGEVAYLHGGRHETQLIGNLPENHFYLSLGGTDCVVANGYRNTIEISASAGGNKVIFLSGKRGALNLILAPAVSFTTAQLKDDDLFLFHETEAHLLTICFKGLQAWDPPRLSRVSLVLEEGTFGGNQLLGLLRAARQASEQASYRLKAKLPEPALQRGFVQLADTRVQPSASKAFLKDQLQQYDVTEDVTEKENQEGQ